MLVNYPNDLDHQLILSQIIGRFEHCSVNSLFLGNFVFNFDRDQTRGSVRRKNFAFFDFDAFHQKLSVHRESVLLELFSGENFRFFYLASQGVGFELKCVSTF